ncbi:MAG TPA: GDSL-type esterase/lipase family protein, partial [Thermoanaerobaculia bacterium]|nr:GDSL-type esterase/lipase family protein [Thermoanaerobaculia bacterium]
MRRFLFWTLPIGGALAAAALFAYGFASYLRGDTGAAIDLGSATASTSAPAPPPATLAPVILGDSLARGTGDETGLGIPGRLDAELRRRGIRAQRTYNFAVNGARTKDLLDVLDRENVRAILRQSNMIIVSIGGNDLWGGSDWRNAAPPNPDATMNEVLGRIEKAVEKIRDANPTARIFFVGLYNPFVKSPIGARLTPLVHRWNARLLDHFGSDPNFTLVQTEDLFSHHDRLSLDRFHPGGEGY